MQRWTRRSEPTGWLRVQLEPSRAPEFLCEYTRVDLVEEKGGRTYFKIVEGYRSVGQTASMKTENAKRYLATRPPGGSATVSVKYVGEPIAAESKVRHQTLIQQWADLSFAGKTARVTLNSLWNREFTPIPPGEHAILAPDSSHANIRTDFYVDAAPGMVGNDTWFPIGLNGALTNSSRYIHVGHLSEGCVTVYELGKWSALYQYLISHRVAGTLGRRVGQLIVQK